MMQSGNMKYYSVRTIQIFFTFHSSSAKVIFPLLFLEKPGAAGLFSIFGYNFLLLFNCVYPIHFLLLQSGRKQRKTLHTQRETGTDKLIDPVGSVTADREKK